MKLGRVMYNGNISVPFEDGKNRLGRTQTSAKRVLKIDRKPTYLTISQKVLKGIA